MLNTYNYFIVSSSPTHIIDRNPETSNPLFKSKIQFDKSVFPA